MLDFSLAEIAVIAVVSVVFIGPKELPVVLKTIAKGMRAARDLMREVQEAFEELAKESGVKEATDEILSETKLIQGDDGQMYESYDMSKIFPKPQILDEEQPAAPEPETKPGQGDGH